MGQKTDQIERHIEAQRAQLGENIDELQERVKDTFAWRTQFEQRPMVMLGIAVGGGLLLSAIVGGRRSRSRNTDGLHTTAETGNTARSFSGNRGPVSHPSESWRDIKNALIGVATAQLGTALDSVIPGFTKQYDKARADGASQAAQSL